MTQVVRRRDRRARTLAAELRTLPPKHSAELRRELAEAGAEL